MTATPARRKITPAEPEEVFQAKIVDLARVYGWRYFHAWRSDHSPAGFPDLVLVKDGRLILAEIKSATGRLTVEQAAWIRDLRAVPCVSTYIWRVGDLPEIAEILGGGSMS